jgi:hypothetical protein
MSSLETISGTPSPNLFMEQDFFVRDPQSGNHFGHPLSQRWERGPGGEGYPQQDITLSNYPSFRRSPW